MRVAAYQAPLLASGSVDALDLIRAKVEWCETQGVTILCCPEAILGGLADYAEHPTAFAIAADGGRLEAALAPLASDTVATIVGFSADVAGRTDKLMSYGSSEIVSPDGTVLQCARQLHEDLIVAEIDSRRN